MQWSKAQSLPGSNYDLHFLMIDKSVVKLSFSNDMGNMNAPL